MFKCNKILAVIDPSLSVQSGLMRAVELAKKNSASVTAFLSIYDFSYEMTTMLSLDERETMRQAVVDDRTDWLAELVEPLSEKEQVQIDIKVVWHNRVYESVIVETLDQGYDLIVKGTQKHDTLKSVIFTPNDWHLLRKAPVPVLLVKEHDWPDDGQVLTAVNIGADDDAHNQLNDKLAKTAKDFAQLLHAHVHVVNAYPGSPVNIAIEIPEFDPQRYNDSVHKHHNERMLQYAESQAFDVNQCYVEEGLPEDVIPEVARRIDAELVVIGTVGRIGLSAALIGNTAEQVIDQLDCDVLAIKPDDFVCPLQK